MKTFETITLIAGPSVALTQDGVVGTPNASRADDTLVYHNKNVSITVQRDGHTLGNVSCGPASGTSLIDRLNKTLNGGLTHPGPNSTINVLRNKMGTSQPDGTTVWGVARGLARFLNQSGLSGNYSITYFGNYTFANGTPWSGGTVVEGTNVSWKYDNNITWNDYIREIFLTDEEVILLIRNTATGGGHFVTGSDLRIEATLAELQAGQFRRFISFMDPWDGNIKEIELVGRCIQLWGNQWCIEDLISVSPVND